MLNYDLDLDSEPWLGLSPATWLALGLGSLLLWSLVGGIAWRVFG